jgi:hypothetical protein
MRVDLNVSTFAHFLTLHVALQVAQAECRLWVRSRHTRRHSITLSARISSVGGNVSPSAFAVLRLITSRNLVAN